MSLIVVKSAEVIRLGSEPALLRHAVHPIRTQWGWAMDRSRLAWLLANWCMGNPKCFTCKIKVQYRRTRPELFPVLSRIQNIGYHLGENKRTP